MSLHIYIYVLYLHIDVGHYALYYDDYNQLFLWNWLARPITCLMCVCISCVSSCVCGMCLCVCDWALHYQFQLMG